MPTPRSILARLALTLLPALMILSSVLPGQAEELPPAAAPPRAHGDHPLTRDDLGTFIDGVMAAQFQSYHIPGAAVAVVKDGEILFAKGYGYSDLEAREPVDATRTLFRIGSVSKLFTWTAVMQLVEQGRLDLNADVNAYLAGTGVHVPATYPEPVTMAHLMNHTAGFEDRGVGLFSHDPAGVRPLGEVLAGRLPQRVRPPGEVTAYSNHGTALAGYIVERMSGMPWTASIEEYVLRPLGMEHTTVRQPVPANLASDLATGYAYAAAQERFEAEPFEYVPAAPAGAASASATDMARFMIAHLQLGRLGDATILAPETARRMQETSYRQDPRLGGIAHGFLEQPYGSLRTIGHGGDTFLFHAELRLVPPEGVGIFVVYSAADGAIARDELVRAFLDRYFGRYAAGPGSSAEQPAQASPAAPGTAQATHDGQAVQAYAGLYGPARAPRTTMDRMIELLSVTTVRFDPTGIPGLLVRMSPGTAAKRFRQVEAGLFQEVDGPGRIAFQPGTAGQPDRILMGSAWMGERLAWYETPFFHIAVAVTCLVVFLSVVVGWPLGWLRERRRRGRSAGAVRTRSAGTAGGNATGVILSARGPRLVRWIAGGFSAVFLATGVTLLIALQDPFAIAFGVPGGLRVVLGLALVAALLSPAAPVAAVVAWRGRYFSRAGRAHVTLVAVAAVVFAVWLNHWNLLGFRF
ncbi:serine hydrolase domain-containing protein [Limnochorda pilosa]|uniref:Beta-lactamase n=1 Tax=Limnochorda pilosa TaxID=1555112 RepID=A0A0K2SH52_LIMPI|nr:serine hydrolase domain-containing protein [Limnochorda pilosa]BAS26420.1 beta-lactamase [Limnochorda pilosa]